MRVIACSYLFLSTEGSGELLCWGGQYSSGGFLPFEGGRICTEPGTRLIVKEIKFPLTINTSSPCLTFKGTRSSGPQSMQVMLENSFLFSSASYQQKIHFSRKKTSSASFTEPRNPQWSEEVVFMKTKTILCWVLRCWYWEVPWGRLRFEFQHLVPGWAGYIIKLLNL